MVVVGLSIAVSGWLLRGRAKTWEPRPAPVWQKSLTAALAFLGIASFLSLRIMRKKVPRVEPEKRHSAFFRAHVVPAIIGGLAVPLGCVYGWMVAPRLDEVAPFWVVALACGFLSLPRKHEVDDCHDPESPSGAAAP
jgi:hypothetical protein